ncbi:MAG TPA: hypothetical protein VMX12_09270, partial [Acidimicrobiia bacterium]|nr:hypothetical protein [Acidimicrobiia bacterium]
MRLPGVPVRRLLPALPRRFGSLAVALAVVAGACSSSDGSGARSTGATGPAEPGVSTTGPTPTDVAPVPDLEAARVALTHVAEVEGAIVLATRADDPYLYFGTQDGMVVAVRDGTIQPAPTLDLGALVRSGGEQGLLGMTFSPDGR